jgi:hypothetical protein
MPSSNPDDTLLLIRCPSCGQRFKVGEDLRGRTVECGGCEHRFRINDDVIVRGKKFYPGERKNPTLNRFQRVPLAVAPSTVAVPAVRYMDPPDPTKFEPTSPQRVVAGIVGVAGMVFLALLLMFGASRGGVLDGMPTQNRLIIAGFTGFLGIVLLVYANPRARMKAVFFGLLLSTGLVSLPLFFKEGSVPLTAAQQMNPDGVAAADEPVIPRPAKGPPDSNAELKNLIGIKPLEEEIARLAGEQSSKRAVGLWLRDLREPNRFLVRDYILRTTGADPQSHYYPRGGGDFLMVVTGIDESIDEFAKVASVLGSLEKVYQEISVVEIRVDNESFIEGPIEKLNNRKDPAFYDLNKRELESVDLSRVAKAVKRLAEAEPKIYRSDISRLLLGLLSARWVDFKADVCRALAVWSETPGAAGRTALVEAKRLLEEKKAVPQEMISLIVKEKIPDVVPVIDQLWSEGPTHWESLYAEVGPMAEAQALKRFSSTDGSLQQSAVRILGKVGGPDSLAPLESALPGAHAELRILIGNAMASIRSRHGL